MNQKKDTVKAEHRSHKNGGSEVCSQRRDLWSQSSDKIGTMLQLEVVTQCNL